MGPLLAFLVAASLAAQQTPRFNTQSRLVLVPVTVTDARGRPVDNLRAADFVILDEGRPQSGVVDSLDTGVAPIALVIAVQASGVSAAALEKVQQIGGMIQPLITGDRGCAALLTFADEIRWRQDCTNDTEALAGAFRKLQPAELKRARMLDAVREATAYLQKRPNVRRVLLLISESRDRGSDSDLDNAIVAAQLADLTVYAAQFSAMRTGFTSRKMPELEKPTEPNRPRQGREPDTLFHKNLPATKDQVDLLGGMKELARIRKKRATEALTISTGGKVFDFARQQPLERAIQSIAGELHTQYVLGFTPQAGARGYHRLEVKTAGHSDFRIRARPGYWSAEQ